MNPNVKLSEKFAVMATLDPASVAVGTVVTAFVPLTNFLNVLALIQTGVLGASATVDAKLRQATDAAGTGVKDITGKALVQLVAATSNNKQVLIECSANDLDATNGYGFVALSLTVGTAASIVGASLIGGNPRYAPTAAFNQAATVQVV